MKYLLMFTVLVFVYCGKKESLPNNYSVVQGDWFSYLMTSEGINTNDYSEVLFKGNRLYRFSNDNGLLMPLFYKISNDSIFFYDKGDKDINIQDYVGNLSIQGKDTIKIINGTDSLVFFRLKSNDKVLSNFITEDENSFKDFDKSHKDFVQSFLKRLKSL